MFIHYKNKNRLILGALLISCPFMTMMHQQLDSTEWDAETIVRNMDCDTCTAEVINTWHVCKRLYAMVNLHPDYCCRDRQYWFVAMLPLKFLILPENYSGPVFAFNGLHQPQIRPFTLKDPALPLKSRKAYLLSYGK